MTDGSRNAWGGIRKLPSGRWQARHRGPDGNRITAPETFTTKAAAQRWLSRKRTELDQGVLIDERLGGRPLSHFWPVYEAMIQNKRRATRRCYEIAWRRHVAPVFGDRPVRSIKASEVDVWLAEMQARGASASKMRERLLVLQRVLDVARRDGAIPTTVTRDRTFVITDSEPDVHLDIDDDDEEVVDVIILPPREIERLCRAITSTNVAARRVSPPGRDGVMVKVMAYGGLRIGEVLSLRWIDISFDKGTIRVATNVDTNGEPVVTRTKTRRIRRIEMPPLLAAALEAHWHDCGEPTEGLVFCTSTGNHIGYNNWRRTWDMAREKIGQPDLKPHHMRHTCASLLIDAGASVKDVQDHLGHALYQTTMNIYAKVRPGRAVDLAGRLNLLIAEGLEHAAEDAAAEAEQAAARQAAHRKAQHDQALPRRARRSQSSSRTSR